MVDHGRETGASADPDRCTSYAQAPAWLLTWRGAWRRTLTSFGPKFVDPSLRRDPPQIATSKVAVGLATRRPGRPSERQCLRESPRLPRVVNGVADSFMLQPERRYEASAYAAISSTLDLQDSRDLERSDANSSNMPRPRHHQHRARGCVDRLRLFAAGRSLYDNRSLLRDPPPHRRRMRLSGGRGSTNPTDATQYPGMLQSKPCSNPKAGKAP